MNHVLLHQSVIGLEAKAALDKYNITPDIVIGCLGAVLTLVDLSLHIWQRGCRAKTTFNSLALNPPPARHLHAAAMLMTLAIPDV